MIDLIFIKEDKEEETDSKSPLPSNTSKENGRPLWTISNSIRSK